MRAVSKKNADKEQFDDSLSLYLSLSPSLSLSLSTESTTYTFFGALLPILGPVIAP